MLGAAEKGRETRVLHEDSESKSFVWIKYNYTTSELFQFFHLQLW